MWPPTFFSKKKSGEAGGHRRFRGRNNFEASGAKPKNYFGGGSDVTGEKITTPPEMAAKNEQQSTQVFIEPMKTWDKTATEKERPSAKNFPEFVSKEEEITLRFFISQTRDRVKIGPIKPSTEREYERRAAQIRAGWKTSNACKNERFLMMAAGDWDYKKRIRALLHAADRILKSKTDADAIKKIKWKYELEKLAVLVREWENFRAYPWKEHPELIIRAQADHKKRPASDQQLVQFHDATKKSNYRKHFIAAEFCGARPEEFGGTGVAVDLCVVKDKQGRDVRALSFAITGAKRGQNGGNGQPLRVPVVPFPFEAGREVKRRWFELANAVKEQRQATNTPLALVVEASEKLTAGQKLTRAFAKFTKGVEGSLSFYSLRNRFSAHAKASVETTEEVAVLLGHSSARTQRFYGRARRANSRRLSPIVVQLSPQSLNAHPVRHVRAKRDFEIQRKPKMRELATWRGGPRGGITPRAPRPSGF
jgi:hypothetical protein